MKKILKKITFALFLLVSLTYLFIVISPKIFKNFYPFGIRTAVVLTGSMEPTININDFIIVKKPNNIEINDIVSYNDGKSKNETLHRVISINGNEVITKGDANNTADAPININQITGVYIGKIKILGSVISFITRPIIFSFIITILFAIIIFPSKKSKKQEVKHEKPKN